MATKKGILKFLIVFILVIFILATGLMSVLYLSGSKQSVNIDDISNISGIVVETNEHNTGVAK